MRKLGEQVSIHENKNKLRIENNSRQGRINEY